MSATVIQDPRSCSRCEVDFEAGQVEAHEAKCDGHVRFYDVSETGRRDNTLIAPSVRARFEREIRAMARGIVDGDGLGVAFELQAMLDDAINARIAELTDPKLPVHQRYSLQDLANGSGMRKQSLSTRAQKARSGAKSARRGPAKNA